MNDALALPARWMSKIQESPEPCWIWLGQHNEKGYAVGHQFLPVLSDNAMHMFDDVEA